jgi:16S rRNA processing protein RimM
MAERVCVGQVLGAHGVHGRIRLKSFTAEPEALFDYAPLTDEAGGRTFKVRRTGAGKDHFLAEVEGVKGREAAEALRGTRLYVARDALPAPDDEDEFYHADLLDLEVVTAAGEPFGRVLAVYDFGAGDLLEIRHVGGRTVQLPFTRAVVPTVDVKGGRLVVDPPADLLKPARPDPEELELDRALEEQEQEGGGTGPDAG